MQKEHIEDLNYIVPFTKKLAICSNCISSTIKQFWRNELGDDRCLYRKRPVSSVNVITGKNMYAKVEGDYTKESKVPYPLCSEVNPNGVCVNYSDGANLNRSRGGNILDVAIVLGIITIAVALTITLV